MFIIPLFLFLSLLISTGLSMPVDGPKESGPGSTLPAAPAADNLSTFTFLDGTVMMLPSDFIMPADGNLPIPESGIDSSSINHANHMTVCETTDGSPPAVNVLALGIALLRYKGNTCVIQTRCTQWATDSRAAMSVCGPLNACIPGPVAGWAMLDIYNRCRHGGKAGGYVHLDTSIDVNVYSR